MKKFSLFASLLLLCSCNSCNLFKVDEPYKKQVYYIFLYDRIDQGLYDSFDHLFYEKRDSEGNVLTDYQPKGYQSITFSLYHPEASKGDNPVKAVFQQGDVGEDRTNIANNFLEVLKADITHRRQPEQDVFRQLAGIISKVKDQQTTYEIFILSGLVANRGSHNNDNMSEDWREGLFRFVDNENKFLPEALDEAKRQLDDQTSWIYKSLIKAAGENQQLRNGKIKIHIHLRLPEGIGETENGRNSQEIIDFWNNLFQRMHISGQDDASDISSYQFYPTIR